MDASLRVKWDVRLVMCRVDACLIWSKCLVHTWIQHARNMFLPWSYHSLNMLAMWNFSQANILEDDCSSSITQIFNIFHSNCIEIYSFSCFTDIVAAIIYIYIALYIIIYHFIVSLSTHYNSTTIDTLTVQLHHHTNSVTSNTLIYSITITTPIASLSPH